VNYDFRIWLLALFLVTSLIFASGLKRKVNGEFWCCYVGFMIWWLMAYGVSCTHLWYITNHLNGEAILALTNLMT
jgi:hypothetical protein